MSIVLVNDEFVLVSPSDALALQENTKSKPKKQKTPHQRLKQQQKNRERYWRNQQLSRFPPFATERPYEIFFVNFMTPFFALVRLAELARETPVFSMDTEMDADLKQPALIQLQFVPDEHDSEGMDTQKKTTMIIFEMCHLPATTAPTYIFVERLFQAIFQPDKTIFSWGDGKKELSSFTQYPIFESIPYHTPRHVNVQDEFKLWYNDTHPHDSDCCMALYSSPLDDPQCSCTHRPYKTLSDKWSLQLAVFGIFGQFLDKSLTVENWGIGLDRRLYENWQLYALNHNITSSLTPEAERTRQKWVQYAVDDCLASTKLAMNIGYEYLLQFSNSYYSNYIS